MTEFFDLIDPVGSKMADDNAPFGPPHIVTWQELAVVIPIILVCAWIAFRLTNQVLKGSSYLEQGESNQ